MCAPILTVVLQICLRPIWGTRDTCYHKQKDSQQNKARLVFLAFGLICALLLCDDIGRISPIPWNCMLHCGEAAGCWSRSAASHFCCTQHGRDPGEGNAGSCSTGRCPEVSARRMYQGLDLLFNPALWFMACRLGVDSPSCGGRTSTKYSAIEAWLVSYGAEQKGEWHYRVANDPAKRS